MQSPVLAFRTRDLLRVSREPRAAAGPRGQIGSVPAAPEWEPPRSARRWMGLPGAAAPQGHWGQASPCHGAAELLSPWVLHSGSAPVPCKPAPGTLPNPCPARIRLTGQITGALSSPGAVPRLCNPPASPYLSAGCIKTPLQHGFLPRGRKFSHSNWSKRYRGEDVIRVEQALKPEDRSNYREPIPLQQSQPQGNVGWIFQRGLRATEAAYPLCPQEK